jgi:hypothetical protein
VLVFVAFADVFFSCLPPLCGGTSLFVENYLLVSCRSVVVGASVCPSPWSCGPMS